MIEDNDDYVHEKHPYAFTDQFCTTCGAELRRWEFEKYEDTCHTCIQEDTSGIIDDNPYKELQ